MKEKGKRLTTFSKISQIALILLVYSLIGLVLFFVFRQLGITLDNVKAYLADIGIWAYVLFIALQVFTNVVLFIIPGQTLQFIALGLTVFTPLTTFFLVLIGVLLASTINFLIGRFLGEHFVKKIIGEDTFDKYQDKLKAKAYLYYPLMMLLPFFPDDEITLLAGITKMNTLFFVVSTLVTRAIGVAGFTFIPMQIDYSFTDTVELILIILAWAYALCVFLYVLRKLDHYITNLVTSKR